jgi:cytochrome o ubiquinol oxidase subunit 1
MAAIGFMILWGAVVARSFVRNTKRVISAAEVEERDRTWLALVAAERVHPRHLETTPANAGLAELHA